MADRRQWTNEEEDLLITILQEVVVSGGRGDNGSFRPGTYDHIVSKMREKMLGININSKHVQNKIKRMKDKYSAAYDMLNTSGFGWDDAKKCVIVDSPYILEEYLKKHPNKNYTANKPFPTYERLAIVFGKDRATGNLAEGAVDALENMNTETEDTVGFEGFFSPVSDLPKNDVPNTPSMSSIPKNDLPSTGETSSKKRKRRVEYDEMTNVFREGFASVSNKVGELSMGVRRFTPDIECLAEELKSMGLDDDQIISVGIYFGERPTQLRFWNSLNASLKPAFLKTIMKGDK